MLDVPALSVAGRRSPSCCPELDGLLERGSTGDGSALGEFYDATIDTLWPLVVQQTGRSDQAQAVISSLYSRLWLDATRLVEDNACTWSLILATTRRLLAGFLAV